MNEHTEEVLVEDKSYEKCSRRPCRRKPRLRGLCLDCYCTSVIIAGDVDKGSTLYDMRTFLIGEQEKLREAPR